MRNRAARSAPPPISPSGAPAGEGAPDARPLASSDGSALRLAVEELLRVVGEEAREAVREALAAERAREAATKADRWLSTADVASRLGRAEKTVRHWIQARGLPAQKHLGVWRVRERDLDGFITGVGDASERSAAASILADLHGA